jgi:AraC-like DNA-binding protein
MNLDRTFEPHLVIREVALPPGGEWPALSPRWCFVHLSAGAGYWMDAQANLELASGSVVVFSHRVLGCVRASQLGGAVLHYFHVEPDRLAGLVTLSEQQFLKRAATQDRLAFRLIAPSDPLSNQFKRLCEQTSRSDFSLRLQLLELFIQTLGHDLCGLIHEPNQSPDAKARLAELLKQMPAAEMLELPFDRLAQQVRCTPRHLTRTFHQLLGMSFREKQAEVRLTRAQELLATTQSKVLEVALESGYQSLSLFNLMFKRRFGVAPGKWRAQQRARPSSRLRRHRRS